MGPRWLTRPVSSCPVVALLPRPKCATSISGRPLTAHTSDVLIRGGGGGVY